MNALPIFLALNYDKMTGGFRFTVDGHTHEINGSKFEAALASILPPESDILKYLVRYNTSVAALLHHKRDLFGLYLLLKIMAPTFEIASDRSGSGAAWDAQQWRYGYKDVYEILSRALRELNQSETSNLSEMLHWSQGFDKAFRRAFSAKLSSHPAHILPKLVYEFVNTGTAGRRVPSL